MHIPSEWILVRGYFEDGGHPFDVWGWGEDKAEAQDCGEKRVQSVLERFKSGLIDPYRRYGYALGRTPIREEILHRDDADCALDERFIVTRNHYGAQVMNAAGLVILDVDQKSDGAGSFLSRLFGGGGDPLGKQLETLTGQLQRMNLGNWRVYRTAAGLRAINTSRMMRPGGADATKAMNATDTDPLYMKLCRAQLCFRARLTPKPWRIGMSGRPGTFLTEQGDMETRRDDWLNQYQARSLGHAVARFERTIGSDEMPDRIASMVDYHDRATSASSDLPLA